MPSQKEAARGKPWIASVPIVVSDRNESKKTPGKSFP